MYYLWEFDCIYSVLPLTVLDGIGIIDQAEYGFSNSNYQGYDVSLLAQDHKAVISACDYIGSTRSLTPPIDNSIIVKLLISVNHMQMKQTPRQMSQDRLETRDALQPRTCVSTDCLPHHPFWRVHSGGLTTSFLAFPTFIWLDLIWFFL